MKVRGRYRASARSSFPQSIDEYPFYCSESCAESKDRNHNCNTLSRKVKPEHVCEKSWGVAAGAGFYLIGDGVLTLVATAVKWEPKPIGLMEVKGGLSIALSSVALKSRENFLLPVRKFIAGCGCDKSVVWKLINPHPHQLTTPNLPQ